MTKEDLGPCPICGSGNIEFQYESDISRYPIFKCHNCHTVFSNYSFGRDFAVFSTTKNEEAIWKRWWSSLSTTRVRIVAENVDELEHRIKNLFDNTRRFASTDGLRERLFNETKMEASVDICHYWKKDWSGRKAWGCNGCPSFLNDGKEKCYERRTLALLEKTREIFDREYE